MHQTDAYIYKLYFSIVYEVHRNRLQTVQQSFVTLHLDLG